MLAPVSQPNMRQTQQLSALFRALLLPCSGLPTPKSTCGSAKTLMQQPHATFLTEFNNGDEMKTTAEDVLVAYKDAQDVALANLVPPISITSALILLLHSLSTQPGCSAPAQPTAPFSTTPKTPPSRLSLPHSTNHPLYVDTTLSLVLQLPDDLLSPSW
ncbi:hypothetical protein C1H46_007562 [Malus baccata]|uniref:Uncharacterized protein n=1 Tax=Malus baccata TaxID=106549 RepID=A0A540N706_MALBA|nr:hypothetical protein C1H46_007562 [Malus baccata]